VPIGWNIALLPVVTLGLIAAAMGVGTLLSALTVAYRDARHAVPFLVQLWMFATPSIFLNSEAVIGPRWRPLLPLNPAYGLIAGFRSAALGTLLDGAGLAISAAVGLALLVFGACYFRRVERQFADVI
jgi:lipopolysaccharide transport system permease protein